MNQDKEQRGSFRHPNMSVRPMLNIRSGSRDGRYTLVIQLIRERRRGVIFTPYRLLPEEFDHLRGKAAATSRRRTHTAFIHEVNVFLEKQKEEVQRILSELQREGNRLRFGMSRRPTTGVTTTVTCIPFSHGRSRSCAKRGHRVRPISIMRR